jgi:hypothetical protein
LDDICSEHERKRPGNDHFHSDNPFVNSALHRSQM